MNSRSPTMRRTSDPMEGLLNLFTQLDTAQDASRNDDGREVLRRMRTFLYANTWCILDAADLIKRYVKGMGPKDKEGQKRRAEQVIGMLLTPARMKMDNSRVLAYVVKEAVLEVSFCSKRLAKYFAEVIVKQMHAVFCRLWRDAARVSYQIEERNSLVDISNLRFVTAFLGDLYSAEILSEAEFINEFHIILQIAQGPTLFHILIYDFLSRALTCSGKKLPAAHWRDIAIHWNTLSAEKKNTRGLTGAVISLFLQDAALPDAHCAIEWELVIDEEMAELCEDIASDFRCKMWDEEEQRVGLELEEEYVTESLDSVGL